MAQSNGIIKTETLLQGKKSINGQVSHRGDVRLITLPILLIS